MVRKEYENCLVRDAVPSDAIRLYKELRVDDMLEIIGLDHHPWTAVEYSVKAADKAFSVTTLDDDLICVFGVTKTHVDSVGCAWMLGTDRIRSIRRDFIRNCGEWANEMMGDYRCLINVVSVSNKISMRWLKWMGAEFLREQPKGYLEFMIPKVD